MFVFLSILVLWWLFIIWDTGQLPLICTQERKKKKKWRDRVIHWRQNWIQQVVFGPVSIQTISQFWKEIEMVVLPREQYFSTYHECPLLFLKFSSLPNTFCFHSPLLSCIVAVVHYVTINKNCVWIKAPSYDEIADRLINRKRGFGVEDWKESQLGCSHSNASKKLVLTRIMLSFS